MPQVSFPQLLPPPPLRLCSRRCLLSSLLPPLIILLPFSARKKDEEAEKEEAVGKKIKNKNSARANLCVFFVLFVVLYVYCVISLCCLKLGGSKKAPSEAASGLSDASHASVDFDLFD